ncbi:hypothetical protein EDD90_2735 [Streptomyces sp. Ag109_O5-1]|nr:hypothetical protein EDD90_2735 [Streptomyces sp. Ag109_O5-1]
MGTTATFTRDRAADDALWRERFPRCPIMSVYDDLDEAAGGITTWDRETLAYSRPALNLLHWPTSRLTPIWSG